jgi:hypothetical protein
MKGQAPEHEQTGYVSYLLRLGSVRSKQELVWRASLGSARTGERPGLVGLPDLLAFVQGRS